MRFNSTQLQVTPNDLAIIIKEEYDHWDNSTDGFNYGGVTAIRNIARRASAMLHSRDSHFDVSKFCSDCGL